MNGEIMMRRNYRNSHTGCSQRNYRGMRDRCSSNRDNYGQSFGKRIKNKPNPRSSKNLVIVANFIEIAIGTFGKN